MPSKAVPSFKLKKEMPVPNILATRKVQYIWMPSRPVLRMKKMGVWPFEMSYTSSNFSA